MNPEEKLFAWKVQFSWYMYHKSDMPFKWCWEAAECAISNDPESIHEDGPIYYAQEEMANWSD